MKSDITRFLIVMPCFVAVMIGLTFLIKSVVPQIVTPYWALLILLFTVVNMFIYFITMKVKSAKDMHKFINFYMIVTIVKLLLYISVLAVYAFVVKEGVKSFIITFLVYYFAFSIFETFILVKK